MDCIFCKIISGAVPAKKCFEDDAVVVFEDIRPKAPTHLLVVPKVHIRSVSDLGAEHGPLIARMLLSAKNIAQENGLLGYRLVFNVGKEGGQEVDHLHLHLLGGWQNTG